MVKLVKFPKLKAKTLQGLFSIAVRGLAKQGWQKSIKGSRCAYRGTDGRKCAIGHCLADKDYRAEFDTSWYGLADLLPREAIVFADKLMLLQRCHDMATSKRDMYDGMHRLATKWGLKWPAGVQAPR